MVHLHKVKNNQAGAVVLDACTLILSLFVLGHWMNQQESGQPCALISINSDCMQWKCTIKFYMLEGITKYNVD